MQNDMKMAGDSEFGWKLSGLLGTEAMLGKTRGLVQEPLLRVSGCNLEHDQVMASEQQP